MPMASLKSECDFDSLIIVAMSNENGELPIAMSHCVTSHDHQLA
jgi:hypothetical protein